ncbi:YqaA family protein [Spirabiliibacterium falconis]|uniref:YqaA family protein n=1 Tax=Spirabiliibacterium falconis TaxID=572023 RepID=UPI001AACDA90|nr:YqaA family protein [Spirabiliibacterium falconis]MBE2894422.1 DedA family protein [Spirabiliibacterium falconis]
MRLFGTLYDKTMQWSRHRFAVYWLALVSFIEAIFFPIPPDVMLIPMAMTRPQRWLKLALITAATSVLGGMIGYFIGYTAYDWLHHYIVQFGYLAKFNQVIAWFDQWGILVLFVAGFSPIPYKLFTLASGVMQMAFFPFVITAFISRAARFLLVAKLAAWGGPKIEARLRRSIEVIGWGVVVLAIIAYFLLR